MKNKNIPKLGLQVAIKFALEYAHIMAQSLYFFPHRTGLNQRPDCTKILSFVELPSPSL